MFQRLALLFYLIPGIICAQNNSDTVSLTKSDNSYFDHSDKLMVGAGYNYYTYDIIFRNISANLIGDLYLDYSDDNFPYKVNKWKFKPSVNRQYANVFLSCRYGTFAYSKTVEFNKNRMTDVNSVQFSIPYKSLSLSFEYLKFTGLNRQSPMNNEWTFLQNMVVRPLSVTLEYSGKTNKHLAQFSSLKNSFLYTPKKTLAGFSFLCGYQDLLVKDSSDFIPALAYGDSTNNPSNIIEINNSYLTKFTSKGIKIGMRASNYFKLFSSYKNDRFTSIYIKLSAILMYNFQRYKFYSINDQFDNPQFNNHQEANSGTTNFYGQFSFVTDLNNWYLSIGANYYSMLFGSPTNSYLDGNSMRDQRYYFQFNVAYRLPFEKMIRKVNRIISK